MYSRTSNRSRSILVFLLVLAALIITLYYRGSGGVISRAQGLALTVVAPAQSAVAAIGTPFRRISQYSLRLSEVTRENQRLQRENIELNANIGRLRQVSAENERLRSLAGFRDDFKLRTTAALVIGRSPTSWQSVATISLGSQDGIKERASVVTDRGLVGQVVTLTKGTAIVQMIDDRRSGVAVEVVRTGATGIVEGRLNGTLRLRFIAGDADIKQGDLVVTSGTGGVYPRGIKVGRVNEISDTAYSLEKEILLRPAVVYRKLSEVLVVTDRPGE